VNIAQIVEKEGVMMGGTKPDGREKSFDPRDYKTDLCRQQIGMATMTHTIQLRTFSLFDSETLTSSSL